MRNPYLPYIPLFPLDIEKIDSAKLFPESKSAFEAGSPDQGYIGIFDVEDNLIYMIPAFNAKDGLEGKELDKDGKPFTRFIRSHTPRVRGALNPQNTGGNLHHQLVSLYGLHGKPLFGFGVWKDQHGKFNEIRIVSSQQLFSIKWKRFYREYFKIMTQGHSAHSQSLFRELPLEIVNKIMGSIRRELGMEAINILEDSAIPADVKSHLLIQHEWNQNPGFIQRQVILSLTIHDQKDVINEIIKETGIEEKDQTRKTDIKSMIEEAAPLAAYMQAAKDGNITQFKELLPIIKEKRLSLDKFRDLTTLNSPLMFAAEVGCTEIVYEILNAFCYSVRGTHHFLDLENNQGKTALLIAIEKGYSDIAKLLLRINSNPLAIDKFGNNPLSLAIKQYQPEIVDYLIDQSAGIHITFQIAVENNDIKTVTVLFEHIKKLSHPEKRITELAIDLVYTPLYLAAELGHVDIFKLILKNCHSQTVATHTQKILTEAIKNNKPAIINEYFHYLLENKFSPQEIRKKIKGLLTVAIEQPSIECAQVLINAGIIITSTNFRAALEKRNLQLIKLITDRIKPKPIHLKLAMFHDLVVARKLFNKITDINAYLPGKKSKQDTPLIMAIKCQSIETVIILLEEYHANPNKVDANGKSPLFIAALGSPDIFKWLLQKIRPDNMEDLYQLILNLITLDQDQNIQVLKEYGVKLPVSLLVPIFSFCILAQNIAISKILTYYPEILSLRHENGETFLIQSILKNRALSVTEILRHFPQGINEPSLNGRTPLMAAVETKNETLTKILLEYKPELNIRDTAGRSIESYLSDTSPAIRALFESYKQPLPSMGSNTQTFFASLSSQSETPIRASIELPKSEIFLAGR